MKLESYNIHNCSRLRIRLLLNLGRDVMTALRMDLENRWENVTTYNLPIMMKEPRQKNNSKIIRPYILFLTVG